MPNVAFPSQAHGMTNKGRGPAVPPVGVCQFTSHKLETNAVIWQKNNDDHTVLLILQCSCLFITAASKTKEHPMIRFRKVKHCLNEQLF